MSHLRGLSFLDVVSNSVSLGFLCIHTTLLRAGYRVHPTCQSVLILVMLMDSEPQVLGGLYLQEKGSLDPYTEPLYFPFPFPRVLVNVN